jgi:predicted ThiF/HesA family dinucleotide-utilizing enzyme
VTKVWDPEGEGIDLALDRARAPAKTAAEAELSARGFTKEQDGSWLGVLPVEAPEGTTKQLTSRVRLPPEFPDKLPEVLVLPGDLPKCAAHVEESGKVCIAPSENLSIDVTRPREVMAEALTRAALVAAESMGDSREEVAKEFLAYWSYNAASELWSICEVSGAARALFVGRVTGSRRPKEGTLIVGENRAQVEAWSDRAGLTMKPDTMGAFVIPLSRPALPPSFHESLSLGEWLDRMKALTATADWPAFHRWLGNAKLPSLLLFVQPAPNSSVPTLAALLLPSTSGDLRKRAQIGFRPGHLSTQRELGFARSTELQKLKIVRLDPEYLVARGGGKPLRGKAVLVVGCGALGSQIALQLAALGVGRMHLIDPQLLSQDNIHRHVLGLPGIGMNKAVAMAAWLGAQYPHQEVAARPSRVESVLKDDPGFILSTDLIVFAVGEDTLERRLNSLLGTTKQRVHSWLETMGVGGHVLLTGVSGSRGCFECLFLPEGGAANSSAFVAPGQDIRRSLGGCAGTFSPFSQLDVTRTAIEAVSLVGGVLLGAQSQSILVSWRGDSTEFTASGFRLSHRGQRVAPGQVIRLMPYARIDCPVCGSESW